MDAAVPMTVSGVRVELPSNTPVVLLREQDGERFLPIWVGPVEAMAISSAMEGVEPPRPQTHDLLKAVIEHLDALPVRVVVTELRDNVFFADLILSVGGREVAVSSRPSDAIALAVRTDMPVFAAPQVLEDAGIQIRDEDEEEAETEIEQFREMLEDLTVEDFMDPGSEEGPSDR